MPIKIQHKNQKYAYFDLLKWDIIRRQGKNVYLADFLNHPLSVIHNIIDNTFKFTADIGTNEECIRVVSSEDELHDIISNYRNKIRG